MMAHRLALGGVILLIALSVGGIGCNNQQTALGSSQDSSSAAKAVTALGRVVTGRSVVSIAAAPGDRLLRLEVKEGKQVAAQEVLAYLESYTLRLAERDAARVALEEAKTRLEAETAYGQAMIVQSKESIRLIETELAQASRDLGRAESLRTNKIVADQQYDAQLLLVHSKELELSKAKAELQSAEASLQRARTAVGLQSAEAQLNTAEARLSLTIIRAPAAGRILRVFTYPGEKIGNDPILQMGDTDRMYVIAQVYETDIGNVKIGQRATVTSAALANPVQGTVDELGWLIYKNDVLDLDPRSNVDTRVVEVRIRMDKPELVAHLTNLEVHVRIDSSAAGAPGPEAVAK